MPILRRFWSLPLAHRIAIAIVILAFAWSTALLIVSPQARTGPFGIGLPAPMQTYVSHRERFSISLPESWGIAETPHGNHGDKEVVAVIAIAGRSFPHGSLARRIFAEADIGAVAAWGESRAQTEEAYVEISLEPIRIAGLDGLQREYSWESYSRLLGLATWRCQDAYVLHGTSGYALSLCADEKHWSQVEPVFRQMIESFSVW